MIDWQRRLADTLAPATVNNHLASLSGFTTWVSAQEPRLFATGNPSTGVSALPLPPLEPRSLAPGQVRSLKNLCDRLERYSQRKGRRRGRGDPPRLHGHSRPVRDRAIVFVLLSTGLRRLELVLLDLDQVQPSRPAQLRAARHALADYLEEERPADTTPKSTAFFLSAASVSSRRPDGRLSGRSINTILERIGRLHDAEHTEPQRRLGHRSQRYIARYTNPPEHVAASYIEHM